MMLSEFVVQDEIILDEKVKQVEIVNIMKSKNIKIMIQFRTFYCLHDAIKHTLIMEMFENGEKDKDSCHSSILKNDEYEVRSMVEFSKYNLTPTCRIFDDLITTTNFQISKILDCGIKSRKCVKIERENCFTSLISLISNNFEPKMKRISRFGRIASLLQKLTKKSDMVVENY